MENTSGFDEHLNISAEVIYESFGFSPVPFVIACVFGAVGVIGNLSMIVTILLNRELRNVTNILIVNAAVGDIAVVLIMLPMNTYVILTGEWPFGDFLCKLSNMVSMFSLTTSAYSFCAISTDRYLAVAKPLSHRSHRVRRISCYIFAIDFIGLMFMIPTYFLAYESSNQCHYLDHGTSVAKIHELIVFNFLYIIPLLVISVNYIRIACVLMRSIRHRLYEGSNAAVVKQHTTRVRLTKSVLLIMIVYGLCMLPYHVTNVGIQFLMYGDYSALFRFMKIMIVPSSICYVLATLVNPVMMFVLSKRYRQHVIGCTCIKSTTEKILQTGSYAMTMTRRSTIGSHHVI